MLRPLASEESITLRLHRAVLYNSIFRADDETFVNPHIFGAPAANAPVLHLRRPKASSMFATYLASFGTVWSAADPYVL